MPIPKVLISDPLNEAATIHLRDVGIEVAESTWLDEASICQMIGEFDGLIVRSGTDVTAPVLEAGAKLKVVGRAGVGVDNIDVPAATRQGIAVINTPEANTISAAEHTVSMMLALARNIPQACAALKSGKWDRKTFVGQEVRGKILGVIGLGKIGREVGARGQALGMKVVGYDPLVTEEAAAKAGAVLVDSVAEVLSRSDFVTLHLPHTDATHHLVDTDALKKCKPGARLINCARGGILDEAAVLEALNDGQLAGVALDVFEKEPPDPDDPLIAHPKVVVTPHLGASTEEAQYIVAVQIAELVSDALLLGDIKNAVNMLPVDAETYEATKPYLEMAERLGRIHTQLAGSAQPVSITVEYFGEALDHPTGLITAAVLKGMLVELTPGTVNLVSSPLLAQERGIRVDEVRTSGGEDFLNLVTVTYEGRSRAGGGTYKRSISSSLFGAGRMRIVRVDDLVCEAVPEGQMVLLWNEDVPGVIGNVGGTIAKHGINIAAMSWQRQSESGNALVIVNVDGPMPDEVLEDLRSLENLQDVRRVTLPPIDESLL